MATITKRPNGYQVQIRKKGFPPLSKQFKTHREARLWGAYVESEMDIGCFKDKTLAENTTLGELFERYLQQVTPLKKSCKQERARILQFLREDPLCLHKMTALTPKTIAAWRDVRLQLVSGSTVNRDLALLSHVINTARREWDIHIENPLALVRRPRCNRGRERRLNGNEQELLFKEICEKSRNPYLLPVVQTAIETGMRRSELLQLEWSRVDLEKRVIRILDTKNGEGRSVPLTLKAVEIISNLPKREGFEQMVFPLTPNALKLGFERAIERSRIDDLRFHDLRHEAVSRFFEKGLNVMEVASISGHKTLQMLKRYTHMQVDSILTKIDAS